MISLSLKHKYATSHVNQMHLTENSYAFLKQLTFLILVSLSKIADITGNRVKSLTPHEMNTTIGEFTLQ